VSEELVRAIRTESAAALKHWFGISTGTVWSWRRAFGVTQWGTEGSEQHHQAVSGDLQQQGIHATVLSPADDVARNARVRIRPPRLPPRWQGVVLKGGDDLAGDSLTDFVLAGHIRLPRWLVE
jgi:hypothetical protein